MLTALGKAAESRSETWIRWSVLVRAAAGVLLRRPWSRGTLGLALAALLEQHPPRVGGGGRTGEWLLRRLELHGRLRSTAEDGRWLSLLRRSCMQFDISFQNGNFIHEFD